MASRVVPYRRAPVGRTAFHGMLTALPISAAMWCAIVVLIDILR